MFSVVIPLYNKELSIRNTLQSVLDQTFTDFEIVIVNDGSTDSSAAVVEEFTDARIRLIHQENQGVSIARNRGIKEAKNKWIAFLDADDEWYPYFLEVFSNEIKIHNPINWAFSAFTRIIKENAFRTIQYKNPTGRLQNVIDDLLNGLKIHTSNVVVKKEFIDKNGLKFSANINRSEDREMWYRLSILDKNPLYINKLLSKYIDHINQYSLTKNQEFTNEMHFLTMKNRLSQDITDLNTFDKDKFLKYLNHQTIKPIYDFWATNKKIPTEFKNHLNRNEFIFLSKTIHYPYLIKRIIRKLIIDGIYRIR